MNMKKSTRPVNRKIDTAQVSGQTGSGIEQRLSPNGSSSMDGGSSGPVLGGDKRKPVTPDEAALTAKNYRLAKELSELRVRHRDETKNVTRLTMEHMNLSSRYREAINTITVLKKELIIHQKTSSDLIVLHKQYVEKYGIQIPDMHLGSLSSMTLDLSENDHSLSISRSTLHTAELSQKILPGSETRGKDNNSVTPTSTSPTSNGSAVSMKTPSTNGSINPLQQTQRLKSRSYEENPGRTTKDQAFTTTSTTTPNTTTAATIPTNTSTTKDLDKAWPGGGKGTPMNQKKSEKLENAFGDLYSNQFFPQNYKSSLTTTPERGALSTADSDIKFDDYLFKTKTGTNVDAFEASFNTSFPSNFSTNSMTSSNMDIAFDVPGFSDPFFPGASSPGSNNYTIKNTSGRLSSSQQDATASNNSLAKLTVPYIDSVAAKRKSLDKTTGTLLSATSSDAALDKRSNELFPSSALNMFESLSVNDNSSKSHRGRSSINKDAVNTKVAPTQELSTSASNHQPPPPPPTIPSPQISDPKINVAASRARFDIAKGNRNETVDPSLVRKARSFELSPTRTDAHVNATSTKRNYKRPGEGDVDEFGKLDEIVANASVSPTQKEDQNLENGQRSRRSVRQPVSYTEPPLNSKMRRGDVFFQKQEDEVEPSQSRMPKLEMRR